MEPGRGPSIVNVASIAGTQGLEGMTGSLGIERAPWSRSPAPVPSELAPKGIRVNAVAPGVIDTAMTRALPKDGHDARVAAIGMGRVGTAQEVANVVLFLRLEPREST